MSLGGARASKIERECEIGQRLSRVERDPGAGGYRRSAHDEPSVTAYQAAVAEGGFSLGSARDAAIASCPGAVWRTSFAVVGSRSLAR
jgi:hypothetical protein